MFSERSGKTHLAWSGGMKLHYMRTLHLSLYVGAQYQKALTSANQDKAVLYFPVNNGWQIGLEKRF